MGWIDDYYHAQFPRQRNQIRHQSIAMLNSHPLV